MSRVPAPPDPNACCCQWNAWVAQAPAGSEGRAERLDQVPVRCLDQVRAHLLTDDARRDHAAAKARDVRRETGL